MGMQRPADEFLFLQLFRKYSKILILEYFGRFVVTDCDAVRMAAEFEANKTVTYTVIQ